MSDYDPILDGGTELERVVQKRIRSELNKLHYHAERVSVLQALLIGEMTAYGMKVAPVMPKEMFDEHFRAEQKLNFQTFTANIFNIIDNAGDLNARNKLLNRSTAELSRRGNNKEQEFWKEWG